MRRNLKYGAGAAVVACLTVGTYYAQADAAETDLSDGTNTELLSGDLAEGTKVVTGVTTGVSQQQARTAGSADPFSSLQQGRGSNGGPRP